MKDRIPFDIEYRSEIEAGKYLVRTIGDIPAKIICWDLRGERPIAAAIFGESTNIVKEYYEDGRIYKTIGSALDLCLIPNPDYKESDAKPSVDWDAFRRDAAKDFAAARLANPSFSSVSTMSIAKACVTAADELIKQLKENKK